MLETNSPILASTKINFVKATLIVALCFLVFWIGKSMFSSMLTIRPETSIGLWEQKKEPIHPELALSYIDRLKLSVAINPNNAKSHFLLAILYELLALEKNVVVNTTYILNAQQSYQNAVFQQPSWYIAWARLAVLNSKLNNNKKAISALEQALILGPYEYKNQRLIIPIIIKYWNTDTFIKKNNNAIRKLFSHALNFNKNHTWLLNRVLESKNISLLLFTAPLIKHQEQVQKFNQFIIDHPQFSLVKQHVPHA